MARNKYPEETVRHILDVAEELFMSKGYEHTTMADIVGGLGGLTKGAVYTCRARRRSSRRSSSAPTSPSSRARGRSWRTGA